MRLPVLELPAAACGVRAAGPRALASVRVLRISITDRCNLRCTYCMPPEGLPWLTGNELLSIEEIAEVVAAAAAAGISRVKITGGEPTVHPRLLQLIRLLRSVTGIDDVSLTTNGILLASLARPLRQAGLDRVTISLDSLRPERFRRITRTGELSRVLEALEACLRAGFGGTKINVVVMRGVNDDEVPELARLVLRRPVTVRFIEYMPIGQSAVERTERPARGGDGCARRADRSRFVPEREIRRAVERALGPLQPVPRSAEPGVGPAEVYRPRRYPFAPGRIGFISAMSEPFCSTCNRLRLTADGKLRACLFDGGEVDVRDLLRRSPAHERRALLGEAMEDCVMLKPDVHCGAGTGAMSRIGG